MFFKIKPVVHTIFPYSSAYILDSIWFHFEPFEAVWVVVILKSTNFLKGLRRFLPRSMWVHRFFSIHRLVRLQHQHPTGWFVYRFTFKFCWIAGVDGSFTCLTFTLYLLNSWESINRRCNCSCTLEFRLRAHFSVLWGFLRNAGSSSISLFWWLPLVHWRFGEYSVTFVRFLDCKLNFALPQLEIQ